MIFNSYFQIKKCFVQKSLIKMKKNIANNCIMLTLQISMWTKFKMLAAMLLLLNYIKIPLSMIFLKLLVIIGLKESSGIKKLKIIKIKDKIKRKKKKKRSKKKRIRSY